jgi:hypothetical protein
MANILYRSPTRDFIVVSQRNLLWLEVFNVDPFYMICKYDPSLKMPFEGELKDYRVLLQKEKLEDCFKWLKRNNIISNDEMKEQIELLCQAQN